MTPFNRQQFNLRLIRMARTAMSSWAHRWRVIAGDPREAETAEAALENAKRLRDMAKRWEGKP